MTLNKVQKAIADKFMREMIKHHIKQEYLKKSVTPTVEQVMQDIPAKKMLILLQGGFTREGIEGIVAEVIGRQKCKG
jgi:hypothetical protein